MLLVQEWKTYRQNTEVKKKKEDEEEEERKLKKKDKAGCVFAKYQGSKWTITSVPAVQRYLTTISPSVAYYCV